MSMGAEENHNSDRKGHLKYMGGEEAVSEIKQSHDGHVFFLFSL